MRHCLAEEYKTKIIKLELIITYFLTFKKGGGFSFGFFIVVGLKFFLREILCPYFEQFIDY